MNQEVSSIGDLDRLLVSCLARIDAREGESEAFGKIFDEVSGVLFAVALNTVPDRADAEEVLQSALVEIYRDAGSFDPLQGRAISWMLTVVRKSAHDRLRSMGS